MIWGVNLKQRNVTAASLQAKAIVQAFSSSAVQNAGVMLQAIEIGNEPDRYKRPEWTVEDYVKKYVLKLSFESRSFYMCSLRGRL